jgi:hypothetical protein
MAGLFDNIFGGSGGMYADLMTPEQQAQIRKQSMLQMAAKLLESSGPSPVRRSLGQTIGGALSSGAEAMQSGQANAVQQMLMRQKLEEAKAERDMRTRAADILSGKSSAAAVTPEAAINAPGGAVGPTPARAANIGASPTPAANDKSTMASRYRELAALFSATDPVKAKSYMDLAGQLEPQEKFSTTPQFGRSADGTPISYVLSESGGMKLLNVQQSPDFNYQDMGGYVSVRDKRTNKEVERIKKSMSPSEFANYQRGSYSVQDTDQGKMYVPTTPGAQAIPVTGPSGAPLRSASADKPTEGQMGASGFANRMEAAEDIFSKIPAAQVPRFGMSGQSSIMSYFRSPEGQMAKQAADDWIRSKLRKESGAVIGEEEMEAEYKTYFPMPGDSAQVVAQKAQARQRATDAMKRNAGPAYVPYTPPPAAAPIQGLGTGTVDLGNYFNSRP